MNSNKIQESKKRSEKELSCFLEEIRQNVKEPGLAGFKFKTAF